MLHLPGTFLEKFQRLIRRLDGVPPGENGQNARGKVPAGYNGLCVPGFRVLDIHIFREFLLPLAFLVFALTSIFLVFVLMSELNDLIALKLGFWDVCYYLYLNIPYLLKRMLPVAYLVAIIYFLMTLAKNNEIVAMRASGISLFRFSSPVLVAAVMGSLFLTGINREVIPLTEMQAKQMLVLGKTNEAGDVVRHNVQFMHFGTSRSWYVQEFNISRNSLRNIEITEQDPNGRDRRKIYARSAAWENGKWHFMDVREFYFDPQGGATEANRPTANYDEFFENPRQILTVSKDVDAMSVSQLQEFFAQSGEFSPRRLAPYLTVYYYRFALGWSVLVVALFSIPFAAGITKRDPVAGVAYPLVLFVAMHFMTEFFLALGKGARMPALVAAWLPLLIFGALGAWLMWRKR
ncbi:MAG: LptF/LptG family permease [Verrucomicrobiae bacterium]|nr:LptF/LptG family permease [Verrucomicrobiae bacterium]